MFKITWLLNNKYFLCDFLHKLILDNTLHSFYNYIFYYPNLTKIYEMMVPFCLQNEVWICGEQ